MTKTSLALFPPLGCALLLLGACRLPDTSAHGPEAARAALNDLVRREAAPGVQYAHLDRDQILFEYATGNADLKGQVPVTLNTTFHGYSVTKTVTAAAVFKLAEEGRLDLDAPLSRWLDGFEAGHPVPTVRETLQHVGGWSNPVPVGWVHLASEHQWHDQTVFFERIMREHGELSAEPGEEFAYSNVGYLALGEVVRRVSGKSYESYVVEDLLAPLALDRGAALGFAFDPSGRHAKGYVRHFSFLGLAVGLFLDRQRFMGPREGAWDPFVPLQVDGSAYGGLLGNARGFARYLQAILRCEGPFSPGVVRGMFQAGRTRDGEPTPAAHGWFRGELGGETYFHHAGGGGGYYAELRVYPRLGRASILLMNRSGMKDDRLLDGLDPPLLPQEALGGMPKK